MSGGLRSLPSVDRVAQAVDSAEAPAVVTEAARAAVEMARAQVTEDGDAPAFMDIVARAEGLLRERRASLLTPVLNATGVLIHTNLGRVPLGPAQLAAMKTIAGGYSNLELDLTSGTRGDRYRHAARLICEVTGAEDALVVNNNAAAVLLSLAGACKGKEVIVSRGELVEIGGEFRIPDVMGWSGAELVEVGTTNRTHLGDYEGAITERTGAILKVHPSNYKIVGFTKAVAGRELARLAHGRGIRLIHDVGSGLISHEGRPGWAEPEPSVQSSLAEGADLVTFSGDKLLGGPQAGVIAGRSTIIDELRNHPLLRTLRVDKVTLAGIEATFRLYAEDRWRELPLWTAALAPAELLRERAEGVAEFVRAELPDVDADVLPLESVVGGGSLPGVVIPSAGVALSHRERTPDECAARLRGGLPPILARVAAGRLVLDLRSIPAASDDQLKKGLLEALG